MQIGETPSEIIDRRTQVHKLMEMEMQAPDLNEDNDQAPLISEKVQRQQQQPQTCFSRFFGTNPTTYKQNPPEGNSTLNQQNEYLEQYDDEWFEKHYKQQTPKPTADGIEGPHEILHIIQPDDSLEGLELQYGVPASRIRNYNHLHGNDIYYLKSISIPDPSCDYQKQETIDWPTYLKEVKINEFVNRICYPEDKSRKVALFYLDMAEWDMKAAIKEYQIDYAFEKNYSKIPKNKVSI